MILLITFFSLAYFIEWLYSITHITHKVCINRLFMLSVKHPANRRPLVVLCESKVTHGFRVCGGRHPACIDRWSAVLSLPHLALALIFLNSCTFFMFYAILLIDLLSNLKPFFLFPFWFKLKILLTLTGSINKSIFPFYFNPNVYFWYFSSLTQIPFAAGWNKKRTCFECSYLCFPWANSYSIFACPFSKNS